MKHWLVKQEPSAYSWHDFVKDGTTLWTGVRNFQARGNLKSMRRGDRVLFYHSVTGKCVMGEARVTGEARPDPTAKEGDWACVELKAGRSLARPVSLEEMRLDPRLAALALLRQSRLSVVPVSAAEYRAILDLARK